MSIERDQDFEQLEDIAAMMAENAGIEFENGKYVYYGLDPRTAFAAAYISGAWMAWKAKAVPEGFVLVPKEPSADLVNHGHQVFLGHFNEGGQTGGRSLYFAYKAMLAASQEPK